MKAYTYKAEEIGLAAWPSGQLRLEGSQDSSAADADIFICPGNLSLFEKNGTIDRAKIYKLPYFKGNESRHCFLDVSDNFTRPLELPCIFFRCDARTWMLSTDIGTVQMAWPVEDFAECIELPAGGFKYDVGFHGWLSSDARANASQSCLSNTALNCDISRYMDFAGYLSVPTHEKYNPDEFSRRRTEFIRSMRESRVSLCPESIPGVLPYRFFEAMSAGRVPILVGSSYVLPFADEIPYDSFCLFIDRSRASIASHEIEKFLRSITDEGLIEKGQIARHFWEQYLDCRKWEKLMADAVEKKLAVMCG